MYIKEMVYLDRDAQKGLWAYIDAHYSMIEEVAGSSYFQDPIAFELEDGDIREMIKPYIMGRIVDVKQFAAQYRCDTNAKSCTINLRIKDHFLPWNNRDFCFVFHDGRCEIDDEACTDKVAEMSIATLTTLLMGYKTAEQLYDLERIQSTPEIVDQLDDVLYHKAPYISDYI